ncbi:MAG: hypothetical protein DRG83_19260 [Deltaproteobacteria bacterium]|nr:MAG: hypothetical protein DRG83_19260 [Deltaproteobacteria bacterium]
MSFWKKQLLIAIIVLSLTSLPLVGFCKTLHSLPGTDTKSLAVTIYNQGKILINEVREITLQSGSKPFELVFEGVPTSIDPTTLQIKSSSSKFTVLDQNYEYDLINTKNLLNKFIGKEVEVLIPDPKGSEKGAMILKKGKLIANNDRPIFEIDNRVYLGSYSSIMLAGIPGNLRARPALVWLIKNEGPKKQKIEVTYLASNCSWKADYVLKVARDNSRADLSGWVTLDNKTGKTFENASLKLVAGKLHQVLPAPVVSDLAREYRAAPMAKAQMKEESFFEYHLYSLPRKVTIKNNQTKQISLLQAQGIKVKRVLIAKNNSPGFYYSMYSGPSRKSHPSIYIKFKNSKEDGLGIPLPKGIVRAYQESSDGSTLFIGEDRIEHTPKNEEVNLKVGEAFDITIERKQTSFEKLGSRAVENGWEIKVRNAKDKPDSVILEEFIPGDWKFVNNNAGFKKISSNWVRTIVKVPPEGEKVLTYKVRIKY